MSMAGSVVYVGDLGSGNVAKLANQVIVAINIAAVSEALTLAKKAGTDPELVYQAIRGGLAGSTVLDAKAPMMMEHNFKPGFRIELHIKDLNNALNASHAVNASLPLTSQLMEIIIIVKGFFFTAAHNRKCSVNRLRLSSGNRSVHKLNALFSQLCADLF